MSTSPRSVERLFPFALRSRIIVVGREALMRMRRKLGFVLIVEGLRPESRAAILADYDDIPVVEQFTSADLERTLNLRGAKVVGFRKSALAASLLKELREFQVRDESSAQAAAEQAEGSRPDEVAPEAVIEARPAKAPVESRDPTPDSSPSLAGAPSRTESPLRPARPWAKPAPDRGRPARPFRREGQFQERPRQWGKPGFERRGERPFPPRRPGLNRPAWRQGEERPADRPWGKRAPRTDYDRPRPWGRRPLDAPREERTSGDRPARPWKPRPFSGPRQDFERPTWSDRGDQPARPWVKRPYRAVGEDRRPAAGERSPSGPRRPWGRKPLDGPPGERRYSPPQRDFQGRPEGRGDQRPPRPWGGKRYRRAYSTDGT